MAINEGATSQPTHHRLLLSEKHVAQDDSRLDDVAKGASDTWQTQEIQHTMAWHAP